MDFDNDNRVPSADIRRKKLKFRAWHRGMKEMDLILGNFADQNLDMLDDTALDAFEKMLHIPDQALYAVLVQGAPVPADADLPLLDAVRAFAKDPLGKA